MSPAADPRSRSADQQIDAERRDVALRRDGVPKGKSVPVTTSVYSLPDGAIFFIHLIGRHTREQWKAMPLDDLPPTGTGPVLVFDVFDEPVTWRDDWSDETRHSTIELDGLMKDHLAYRRSGNPIDRAKMAKRIRRRWCALVDHAIGYRDPGSNDVFEFL